MKTMGQHLYRLLTTLIVVLLVLVLAAPQGGVSAQASAPRSDDFNICTLTGGIWSFENPANIAEAAPQFTGAYSGNSHVKMTVPAGQTITFSGTNQNAPRLMQAITDDSFEVETQFVAPMTTDVNNWKIMGMLVRDASQSGQTRWLRFDFNSRNGGLNGYAGYLAGTDLTGLHGPTDLPGTNPTSGPLTLRVKYDKATSNWTATWFVGASGTLTHTFSVNESALGANFVPTHIGIFVASTTGTGTTPQPPPGNTVVVDYFRNLASPLTDDGVVLTVNKAGSGQGDITRQCTGNQVTLTATPASGSSFVNWTGDVSPSPNSNPTITVPMTQSRTVTANFSGSAAVQNFRGYMPIITQ